MTLPDGQLDLTERERDSSGAPTVGKLSKRADY